MYDAVLESSVEGTHEVFTDTLKSCYDKWNNVMENTDSVLEKQFQVRQMHTIVHCIYL